MAESIEKGIENLEIWKKAINLEAKVCIEVVPSLPIEEKWCLGSQLRRSAQSIPANIAEGYGRYNYQDTIRSCYIARGSVEETKSHLVLASRLGYVPASMYAVIAAECKNLLQINNGYMGYLKQCKRGANEPGAYLTARGIESIYDRDSFRVPNPGLTNHTVTFRK
jgi:four helix bundle protein